jgi:hypothetical protein
MRGEDIRLWKTCLHQFGDPSAQLCANAINQRKPWITHNIGDDDSRAMNRFSTGLVIPE